MIGEITRMKHNPSTTYFVGHFMGLSVRRLYIYNIYIVARMYGDYIRRVLD
jgi:hypothetical protein